MKRIGWNFREKPPTPFNRSTTDGERDQVHKIFILQSQSKEASTRWFTSVKSRPIDRLVFFTAKWFKIFFFTSLMSILGSVYCNNGSADVVFATVGKNWQKKTDFSEIERSRIYLLILTGGTDSDRSRVVRYCPRCSLKLMSASFAG